MIRHWPEVVILGVLAAIAVLSWVLSMARAASRPMPPMPPTPHQQIRDQLHAAGEIPVSDGYAAIHERLYPTATVTTRWPDECSWPPCNAENRWVCPAHQEPQGKHHTVHVITDLDAYRQKRVNR